MPTFSHVVVVALVAVLLPMATLATDYVVGDDSGWTNAGFDYQAWAKDKVFYVGDRLVFKYKEGAHDVYKVNATAFASCTVPPPGTGLKTGHDVVTLMAPGKKWYICGVGNHCSASNQKLAINVVGAWPAPAPSSATSFAFRSFMAIIVVLAAIAMF